MVLLIYIACTVYVLLRDFKKKKKSWLFTVVIHHGQVECELQLTELPGGE